MHESRTKSGVPTAKPTQHSWSYATSAETMHGCVDSCQPRDIYMLCRTAAKDSIRLDRLALSPDRKPSVIKVS
jgi:hypothetical protein